MSRMSDRELYVSVFNTALQAGAQLIASKVELTGPQGKEVGLATWAAGVAGEVLKNAPKDEA